MTTLQVCLGGVVAFLALILIVGYFMSIGTSPAVTEKMTTETKGEKKERLGKLSTGLGKFENSSNTIWLIVLWSFLYFTAAVVDHIEAGNYDWWWNNIFKSGAAWWLILGFTLAGWAMYKTKPFRYKLANIVMLILVVVSVYYLFLSGGSELKTTVTAKASAMGIGSQPLLPENEEGRKVVTEFWNKELPNDKPEVMIQISEKESGFNQFEVDGTTPYRGRINSHDVGIMQINETTWREDAEALGYNIDTLEGNLKMALYIRKTRGASEWTTYKDVVATQTRGLTVIAPVGTSDNDPWSDKIATPWSFSWGSSETSSFAFKRSDGSVVTCDSPCKDFSVGTTKSLQIQSRGAKAVEVTVKRIR